ncbi:hypothetical protein T459_02671 [Capsicum annuum]|uniref:Uncharacterized protein n=1 Tax=Capsicum annuum TaxID=4072 RepID=A0A2G3AKM4_CAPAN|nr:hypothetical protein T459_02671 [Capsicum annuum]
MSGVAEVQDNSVVGSQSVVLPRSLIQKDVILGALSAAPMYFVIHSGGIYVGSQAHVMIRNTHHAMDERIEEMDTKYKIVGNLGFSGSEMDKMYVKLKLKLRPCDENIREDSGKVEPTRILPPETGAIPRKDNDMHLLLFLVDDFKKG